MLAEKSGAGCTTVEARDCILSPEERAADGDHLWRRNTSSGHTGYWLLTGAVIGYGVIAIWSIGFLFIILGIVLMAIGLIRMRGSGGWAAVVGFGGLPALILLWDVTRSPWACQPAIGDSSQPNVAYYTCVDTFVGRLTSYHVLAFWFGMIALLGFVWPLARYLIRRSRRTEA